MAEKESLIGKIARATIFGMSGAPDVSVEGPITRVYIKEWNPKSGRKYFDPYERVEIEFLAPESGEKSTLDTTRADVTFVD